MMWTDEMIQEKIDSIKKLQKPRVIKCPQCGSEKYRKQEGCALCGDCGYSPCK